jgi:hypothetical protein
MSASLTINLLESEEFTTHSMAEAHAFYRVHILENGLISLTGESEAFSKFMPVIEVDHPDECVASYVCGNDEILGQHTSALNLE